MHKRKILFWVGDNFTEYFTIHLFYSRSVYPAAPNPTVTKLFPSAPGQLWASPSSQHWQQVAAVSHIRASSPLLCLCSAQLYGGVRDSDIPSWETLYHDETVRLLYLASIYQRCYRIRGVRKLSLSATTAFDMCMWMTVVRLWQTIDWSMCVAQWCHTAHCSFDLVLNVDFSIHPLYIPMQCMHDI